MKDDKILDISKVPADHVRFAWLTCVVDNFNLIIISKEQAKKIFLSNNNPWDSYKGIPLKIK